MRILYVSQYFPPEMGARPRASMNCRANGSAWDMT